MTEEISQGSRIKNLYLEHELPLLLSQYLLNILEIIYPKKDHNLQFEELLITGTSKFRISKH